MPKKEAITMSKPTDNDEEMTSEASVEKEGSLATSTENERFLLRARRVRARYERDTAKTIEKALDRLEELAEMAHKRATSKYLPTADRQNWARIEAHIYQTINALMKTYDSQRILEKLEELTRNVEKLMEQGSEPREKD